MRTIEPRGGFGFEAAVPTASLGVDDGVIVVVVVVVVGVVVVVVVVVGGGAVVVVLFGCFPAGAGLMEYLVVTRVYCLSDERARLSACFLLSPLFSSYCALCLSFAGSSCPEGLANLNVCMRFVQGQIPNSCSSFLREPVLVGIAGCLAYGLWPRLNEET